MDLILPSRFGQEILSMLLKIAKFPNEEYIMHNFRLDFSDDSQHFRCITMHYESSFTKKFKVGKKKACRFLCTTQRRMVRARSQAFEDD